MTKNLDLTNIHSNIRCLMKHSLDAQNLDHLANISGLLLPYLMVPVSCPHAGLTTHDVCDVLELLGVDVSVPV